MYTEAAKIEEIVKTANSLVIVQADNPDVDSLASALAVESILEELGKKTFLYCGVDLPSYMHYLPGWGRVFKEMPKQFDASIIVDTSSSSLLEQLTKQGSKSWLAARPSIVIDHHATPPSINFASVILNPPAVATGEVIYELAQQLKWPLSTAAKELLTVAILSDSLGLMSDTTTARSIHIIGELVEGGVKLAELESARRETMRRDPVLIHYKGELLQRVEFYNQDRLAMVTIPWPEIERYSPLYNPSMLVLDDMRLARDTDIAVALKIYSDNKITAKIRCNYGVAIADKLAENFGGGGHPLASGFKLKSGQDLKKIKEEIVKRAAELLDELEKVKANETV